MKSIATEIKWGIFYSIVAILWIILEYAVGLHTKYIGMHFYLTWVFIVPAFVMYILALREKRARVGGAISFKRAFISGLLMTVVLVIVSPILMPIYFKLINPGIFDAFQAYSISHGMSKEAAESYFNYSSYVLQGMIGNLFMGLLLSLLSAAIIKRKTKEVYSHAM